MDLSKRAIRAGHRSGAGRLWWLVAVLIAIPPSCQSAAERESMWPPEDFHLDIDYAVVSQGRRQVRQSARVFLDGLVVYREAETSLQAGPPGEEFPIFRRVSAYRMPWQSIRLLSRELYQAPVLELRAPVPAPPIDEENHLVHLDLTFMLNHIDVTAQNQAFGLMNRILRIVNQYLPAGHGVAFAEMAGESMGHCLQDVPPVADSLHGSLRFHETWLRDHPSDLAILRDTFTLACVARDWRLADVCLARAVELRSADAPGMRRTLAAARVELPASSDDRPGR